ncbi:nicotinate phosphoribosyltransferase [Ambystoma mexicanum]|uniref:nicotinate phosphoribosyltransferase n=1 Tax=Ambystoma mexicanum TaxID=8296 RepID=UPI0037E8C5D4
MSLTRGGGSLALLTDLYQFTMAYGYWRSGRHCEQAEFELFFRDPPFKGGFSLFCGLQEALLYLRDFRLTEEEIAYLESVLPNTTDKTFFEYLKTVDASEVTVTSFPEGSVVFAKEPLMQVKGPLLVVQLLETTLLCLINFASLVATNAARMRMIAGPHKKLLEFGLRRAQGPNGGLSASKYSYIGGFDYTSNVLAGKLYNIPVTGTVAHSYITSFSSLEEVQPKSLMPANGDEPAVDFLALTETYLARVCQILEVDPKLVNLGELAAFVSYAIAFPHNFLALVDSYSVMRSGIPNFCAVTLALHQLGYQAIGVRLDSGDLAKLSLAVRCIFLRCSEKFEVSSFLKLSIGISNNISERSLLQLNQEANEIDAIGVGTNLVTCPLQPSLGCVYKLVQVNGCPRMKLSEDHEKMTIPGSKSIYRLFDCQGHPFLDLMAVEDEPPPPVGQEIELHVLGSLEESKKVTPGSIEVLHRVCFKDGQICEILPSISEIKTHAQNSLSMLSTEHKKLFYPEAYKVAVTEKLYQLHNNLRSANQCR